MTEARKRLYYGWIVLAAVVFVMLGGSGIRAVFGVFIKPIEAEFGWTRASSSRAPRRCRSSCSAPSVPPSAGSPTSGARAA